MPTTTELRQEITAAQAALQPQLRGLEDLTHVSLTAAPQQFVSQALAARGVRNRLLNAVQVSLDALDLALAHLHDDGYPALADFIVPAAVAAELAQQEADEEAAFAVFAVEGAASLVVNLGTPVPK